MEMDYHKIESYYALQTLIMETYLQSPEQEASFLLAGHPCQGLDPREQGSSHCSSLSEAF